MRACTVLLTLLVALPFVALADGGVVVETLTVESDNRREVIAFARMDRDWLLSWGRAPQQIRSVFLQPVSDEGTSGAARRFEGCTLAEFTGTEGEGSNVVRIARIRCRT